MPPSGPYDDCDDDQDDDADELQLEPGDSVEIALPGGSIRLTASGEDDDGEDDLDDDDDEEADEE